MAVFVGVNVFVGVLVGVCVGVNVLVGVWLLVGVKVLLGVFVGVWVGVNVWVVVVVGVGDGQIIELLVLQVSQFVSKFILIVEYDNVDNVDDMFSTQPLNPEDST